MWLLALSRLTALYNITEKKETGKSSKTVVNLSCLELDGETISFAARERERDRLE